jgi:chaperonin GroES
LAPVFWHSPKASANSRARPAGAAGMATASYWPRKREKDMKIRPLQDRLVVKRTKEEEKTKGGIIIPDTAKEKPLEGVVLAVGSGKVLKNGKVVPLDVKENDRVLFGKYSGTEVKVDGEELVLLREDDILAVFTP